MVVSAVEDERARLRAELCGWNCWVEWLEGGVGERCVGGLRGVRGLERG